MENRRILYFDIAKALAIYLVVLGHVIVLYDSRAYASPFAQYIYSFHTALFMFLSGIFFSNALRKDFVTLMREKSRQLLLPYISWSLVLLLVIEIPRNGFDQSLETIKNYVLGGAFRYFWYIKVLFLYIVTTYIFIKMAQRKWIGLLASLALFILLPGFSFSNIFIPFFLTGYLSRDFIESAKGWWPIGVLAIIDVVLYSLWQPSYNYSVDMSIVSYVVRTAIGIVTSLLIILVIKKICSLIGDCKQIRNIAYIGTITLGIYVSHEFFYSDVIWGWMFNYLPSDNGAVYAGWAIVVTICSSLLVKAVSGNSYLSFVFLGKKLDL